MFKDETAVHLSPFIFGKKPTAMDLGDDRDRSRERLRFPTCQVWAESISTLALAGGQPCLARESRAKA